MNIHFKNISQLAKKMRVKVADYDRLEKFKAEQDRLKQFDATVNSYFTGILNEMEGDILTLREKKYDKTDLKELIKVFSYLIEIKKNLPVGKPYEAAQKLINTFRNKIFKTRIALLNNSIQHFLQANQVSWEGQLPLDVVSQASVNSLNKLDSLADYLHEYIVQNPLIQDWEYPSMGLDNAVPLDPEYKSSGPEEGTKIEGKT